MGQQPPNAADLSGPVATTKQLKAQFKIIAENKDQLSQLRNEVVAAADSKNKAVAQQDVERGKPLLSL